MEISTNSLLFQRHILMKTFFGHFLAKRLKQLLLFQHLAILIMCMQLYKSILLSMA